MNETSCMLIAGEASGDGLAAELVEALKATGPWAFFGAGGPRMASAGVRLDVDLTAHAVVGLWEVAKHYPQIRRFFWRLIALAMERLPELIIVVDYPGFNLRFVKAIRRLVQCRRGPFFNWRPKIVYYVSPQLWAWHPSRVHQIARDVDLLLSIFPFEKSWYAERVPGFRVEYVGHPIKDRYGQPVRSQSDVARPGAPTRKPLVLLLPGSRIRELNKHLPTMVEAVRLINQTVSSTWRMVLPSPSLVGLARKLTDGIPELAVQSGGLAETLAETTVAIAASGTVTMECAYFGVPTVVIYRTSGPTYQIAKRVIKVKYLAMPNLLAGEAVYPELVQHNVAPERIAAETLALLKDEARQRAIKQKLAKVVESLGPPGASQRAARAICSLFQSPP
jgi:lipid-A-disaccharide synthase